MISKIIKKFNPKYPQSLQKIYQFKQNYPQTLKNVYNTKMDKNIYGKKLKNCSYNNIAKTGYNRNGFCTNINQDQGSHQICLNINPENTTHNFCLITGQPNWCAEKSPCHQNLNMNCNKKEWCVCNGQFNNAINKIGCDAFDIDCEATNISALEDFRKNPQYQKALECIKKKCKV